SDGLQHNVSAYLLDWESIGRTERIDVMDVSSGAVLDSRTVTDMSHGRYLTWTLTGDVALRVVRLGGLNAVLSGLFFDPTAPGGPVNHAPVLASAGPFALGSIRQGDPPAGGISVASFIGQLPISD